MSSFKEKNVKKNVGNKKRITLDAQHSEKIKELEENNKIITKLQTKLNKYEIEFNLLKNKKKTELSDSELEHYFFLKDNIEQLNIKINNINNNQDINDYFLNTGDILFKYYDTFNVENNTVQVETDIMNYLNKNKTKETNDKQSRAELLDNYLNVMNENHSKEFCSNEVELNICKNCNQDMYLNTYEGLYECEKCGNSIFIMIDSDKPSYKETPREVSYFAYKRINHFNEWLAQFQAKESTEIPKNVFDLIWIEIKKERITNMANLSKEKLREILKKLKLNKYYEHVPHIINRLNGLPAPIMNRDTEEKLRNMFKEIQIPFIKHCPKDRKNFLSYSYVLHKFVELLNYDQFLINFPLLKSREKLHQQDAIWKEICKELKWEFIRSI